MIISYYAILHSPNEPRHYDCHVDTAYLPMVLAITDYQHN